jgi:TetR/AcrR family transcriptional regulator
MNTSPDLLDTPHKRERRKQDRPGELLDAALTVFVEKGYAAARVEEVATRAGVSKGTLFLYFPSKEELFKAVVRDNVARHVADGLREVAEYTGPSAGLMREFVRRWWQSYGGTPAAGLTKLIMAEAANFPALAAYYRQEVVLPQHELIRQIVQRGIDGGEFRPVNLDAMPYLILAPLLQLALWCSTHTACLVGPALDAPAMLDMHADMVVRGLQVEGGLA